MNQVKTNPFQSNKPAKPPAFKPFKQDPLELGGSNGKSPLPENPTLGDLFDNRMNYIADSLFSSSDKPTDPANKDRQSEESSGNPFADALKREQGKNQDLTKQLDKQKHLSQHNEMKMKEIYDLDKRKSEETIKQIKNELGQLIKELAKMGANVDQSIHTATFQGRGETGQYYENFFAKLRNFLMLLTKKVREGNSWMQTFNSKKGKSVYQKNSAKYGSQYMFGSEGQGFVRQNG